MRFESAGGPGSWLLPTSHPPHPVWPGPPALSNQAPPRIKWRRELDAYRCTPIASGRYQRGQATTLGTVVVAGHQVERRSVGQAVLLDLGGRCSPLRMPYPNLAVLFLAALLPLRQIVRLGGGRRPLRDQALQLQVVGGQTGELAQTGPTQFQRAARTDLLGQHLVIPGLGFVQIRHLSATDIESGLRPIALHSQR